MQNVPTSKKHPKQNTELKKWLPAIMLAIILHLIVVIAFLLMQKHNATKVLPKAVIPTAQTSLAQAGAEGVGNAGGGSSATEAMVTITQAPNEANGLASSTSSLNPSSAKQTGKANASTGVTKQGTLTTAPSSTLVETAKDKQWLADRQGKLLSNTTVSTTASTNQTANTAGNSNANARVNVTPLTTGASNGEPSDRNSNRNPNEGLLLPRDAPKPNADANGSTSASAAKEQYATASQEIEDINDKLSQTINAVKERKMRQIQQDALLEQAAHAQDQANKLQSQVRQVGQELGVDKLAEKEFATVTTSRTNDTVSPAANRDKPSPNTP